SGRDRRWGSRCRASRPGYRLCRGRLVRRAPCRHRRVECSRRSQLAMAGRRQRPGSARGRASWRAHDSPATARPQSPLAIGSSALAWRDDNANRIDDGIERVHDTGWNAAFVNGDPAQRMIIGVEHPLDPLFAIYVGYDHHPTAADEAVLLGTGVTMAWPFYSIDYLESHATF